MKKLFLTYFMMVAWLFSAELEWSESYQSAVQQAKEEGKYIYLLVTTEQCRWCRKLEATTLKDEKVIQRIHQKYVPVHVTRDKDDYPSHIKPRGVPHTYFLNTEGRVVHSMPGFWDVMDYLSVLDDAERKIKRIEKQ